MAEMTFEEATVDMHKGAVISPCRKYRYQLERIWDINRQYAVFIGLNPSTADAVNDDPTIRRCMRYAYDWGYGGVIMLNLFAFRATKPRDMFNAYDPIGPLNDEYLVNNSKYSRTGVIVAGWGTHGSFINRDKAVKDLIKPLHCLSITNGGHPGHPLYLKKDLKPVLYSGDGA